MRTSGKTRRRARERVLQGLYEWKLSGNDPETIRRQLVENEPFDDVDAVYFGELWTGVVGEHDALLAAVAPFLDRAPAELSPIERSILAIGAWELAHRPDVPYKVAINEAIDLAKAYGGTDGHKYVNGVLDKLAARVRRDEIAARSRERNPPPP